MKVRKGRNDGSDPRLPRRGIGGALMLAMMFVVAPGGDRAVGGMKANYEKQPVLKASQLAPAELLKGAHFQVDETVPTETGRGWSQRRWITSLGRRAWRNWRGIPTWRAHGAMCG
jgi:hypothetical protein